MGVASQLECKSGDATTLTEPDGTSTPEAKDAKCSYPSDDEVDNALLRSVGVLMHPGSPAAHNWEPSGQARQAMCTFSGSSPKQHLQHSPQQFCSGSKQLAFSSQCQPASLVDNQVQQPTEAGLMQFRPLGTGTSLGSRLQWQQTNGPRSTCSDDVMLSPGHSRTLLMPVRSGSGGSVGNALPDVMHSCAPPVGPASKQQPRSATSSQQLRQYHKRQHQQHPGMKQRDQCSKDRSLLLSGAQQVALQEGPAAKGKAAPQLQQQDVPKTQAQPGHDRTSSSSAAAADALQGPSKPAAAAANRPKPLVLPDEDDLLGGGVAAAAKQPQKLAVLPLTLLQQRKQLQDEELLHHQQVLQAAGAHIGSINNSKTASDSSSQGAQSSTAKPQASMKQQTMPGGRAPPAVSTSTQDVRSMDQIIGGSNTITAAAGKKTNGSGSIGTGNGRAGWQAQAPLPPPPPPRRQQQQPPPKPAVIMAPSQDIRNAPGTLVVVAGGSNNRQNCFAPKNTSGSTSAAASIGAQASAGNVAGPLGATKGPMQSRHPLQDTGMPGRQVAQQQNWPPTDCSQPGYVQQQGTNGQRPGTGGVVQQQGNVPYQHSVMAPSQPLPAGPTGMQQQRGRQQDPAIATVHPAMAGPAPVHHGMLASTAMQGPAAAAVYAQSQSRASAAAMGVPGPATGGTSNSSSARPGQRLNGATVTHVAPLAPNMQQHPAAAAIQQQRQDAQEGHCVSRSSSSSGSNSSASCSSGSGAASGRQVGGNAGSNRGKQKGSRGGKYTPAAAPAGPDDDEGPTSPAASAIIGPATANAKGAVGVADAMATSGPNSKGVADPAAAVSTEMASSKNANSAGAVSTKPDPAVIASCLPEDEDDLLGITPSTNSSANKTAAAAAQQASVCTTGNIGSPASQLQRSVQGNGRYPQQQQQQQMPPPPPPKGRRASEGVGLMHADAGSNSGIEGRIMRSSSSSIDNATVLSALPAAQGPQATAINKSQQASTPAGMAPVQTSGRACVLPPVSHGGTSMQGAAVWPHRAHLMQPGQYAAQMAQLGPMAPLGFAGQMQHQQQLPTHVPMGAVAGTTAAGPTAGRPSPVQGSPAASSPAVNAAVLTPHLMHYQQLRMQQQLLVKPQPSKRLEIVDPRRAKADGAADSDGSSGTGAKVGLAGSSCYRASSTESAAAVTSRLLEP